MLSAHLKKLIAVICLISIVGLLIPPLASAQTYTANTNYGIQNNLHNNTQVVLIETMSAVLCQLVGIDAINPNQPCLSIDRTTNKIGFIRTQNTKTDSNHLGGILGLTVSLIGMTYNLPIHTTDYTQYIASNFGLIKQVYAQGSGFTNLTPLLSLWTRVRNLAYLAFVIVFVIIGFAIMLRIKIDPRTTMSIQNQIPKVIISILLITFSYAIAGLLIDAMWVTTYTGVNLLAGETACPNSTTETVASTATGQFYNSPFSFVGELLKCSPAESIIELSWKVSMAVGSILSDIVLAAFNVDNSTTSCHIGLNMDWGQCGRAITFGLIRDIVAILAVLIFAIAIIVQLFRVWLALIKAYLFLVYYTLVSPLWILLGLPFGSTRYGFSGWIRHMLYALSIYPITIFLFVIAIVLANDPNINSTVNNFIPPLVANPNINHSMGYILALAVILIAPEVTNMMRESFKVEQSKHIPAIMAAVGVGASSATSPIRAAGKSLFARDQTGGARGPLAFAMDTKMGNLTKGIASRNATLTRMWNHRFNNTVDQADLLPIPAPKPKKQSKTAQPTPAATTQTIPAPAVPATPAIPVAPAPAPAPAIPAAPAVPAAPAANPPPSNPPSSSTPPTPTI
jgi:hypothetical protein